MGLIVLVVGVIGLGAVFGAIVVFAVLRSRRNSTAGQVGPSTYPQNTGYSPQQPIYQSVRQTYPTAPNQGHLAPPMEHLQHPNPYIQQPPHQAQ